MKTYSLLSAAGLVCTATLFAAEHPLDRQVIPFVDSQTVAILRVTPNQLHWGPLANLATHAIAESGERTAAQSWIKPWRTELEGWLHDWTSAGGGDLYWVLSLSGPTLQPGFWVLPIPPGASPHKLLAVTRNARIGTTARIHDSIVVADRTTLDRLRSLVPSTRPEVTEALSTGDASACQLFLVPTEDTRKVVEQLLPKLPEAIGGGPSSVLTRNLRWLALSIQSPPNASLALNAQAPSTEAAAVLGRFVRSALRALGHEDWVVRNLTQWPQIQTAFEPKVQGTSVQASLGPDLAQPLLAKTLLRWLVQAKAKAMQIQCVNNLKRLGLDVARYASNHNGRCPDSLLALKGILQSPAILTCPADVGKVRVTDWAKFNPQNITYQYFPPPKGVTLQQAGGPQKVMLRCPIHGSVCLYDGSVHQARPSISKSNTNGKPE